MSASLSESKLEEQTPSKPNRLVDRIKWFVLFVVVALLTFWWGNNVQYKVDYGLKLSGLDEFGKQLSLVPEKAWMILGDPTVLQDLQKEAEDPIPEGEVFVFGEDKIPVDKNYLYSRYHPATETITVDLRALSTNELLHRWEWDYQYLAGMYDKWLSVRLKYYPVFREFLTEQPRVGLTAPLLLENNCLCATLAQAMCCFDAEGNLKWMLDPLVHHSIELDHEGHVWTCSMVADEDAPVRQDTLLQIDAETGTILYEKSLDEIFAENPKYDFRNLNSEYPDPFHLNDIQPAMTDSEYWRQGDVFLSLRSISTVLLFRPSTGEILWSNSTAWTNQHDVEFVDAETISVFDNNTSKPRHLRLAAEKDNDFRFGNHNRCVFYNFRTGEAQVKFAEIFETNDCRTIYQGRVKYFADDRILYIEENDNSFAVIADLKSGQTYKCILAGNSPGKAGELRWFRLQD